LHRTCVFANVLALIYINYQLKMWQGLCHGSWDRNHGIEHSDVVRGDTNHGVGLTTTPWNHGL